GMDQASMAGQGWSSRHCRPCRKLRNGGTGAIAEARADLTTGKGMRSCSLMRIRSCVMKLPMLGACCLGVFLAVPVPTRAETASGSSADQQFKAIYEEEWSWRQQQFPGTDDDREDAARVNHLPHVDAETQKQRLQVWSNVLKQLDALPVDELSAAEQINFAVYRPQIGNFVADIRFGGYEMPFNSDSSFWSDLGFMTRRPLRTVEDAEDYIARLTDVPRYFAEQILNMRAGLKRGFSVPRAVLPGRDASIAMVDELAEAAESEFFKPHKE